MAKHLPRYKRTQEHVPLRIQPRDIALIHQIYQYRFLQTNHLVALNQANKGSLYRRLRKLYHNRFIDRLYFPVKFYSGPVEPFVYALDIEGAHLLAEQLGIPPEHLKWDLEENKLQEHYLRHALMVSSFHTIVECATRDHSQLELVFWKQGKELEDKVVFEDSRGRESRVPIVPDAFFCLNDKRPNKKGKLYFFVECDRSTMDTRRFLRKMRGYWHYWEQEKQVKKFGIEDYRVLTLTISPQRRDHLAWITQQADEEQTGSYMFWFATEKELSLEKPESLLGRIWITAVANDKQLRSLSE